MVAVVAWLGLGVVVALHALVAAITLRWLRVRLETRWSPPLFALLLVPVLLVGSTLLVSGGLGLGPDLGGPGAALFVLVGLPMTLGFAVDYLWMPDPAAVERPASLEE